MIRTYQVSRFINAPIMGKATTENITSFFRITDMGQLFENLGIEWRAPVYSLVLHEIIFLMSDEQYLLWRCAGGEQYCLPDYDLKMKRYLDFLSTETLSQKFLEPLGFELSLHDGSINYHKNDIMFSFYRSGYIRCLSWDHDIVKIINPYDGNMMGIESRLQEFIAEVS